MSTKNTADKLILALDGMDKIEAFRLIRKIPELCWVKVGLELFISEGPDVILALKDLGLKVFLDLKLHDIPNTMGGACRQAARSGAELLTVHACAGLDSLIQANESAKDGAAQVGLPAPTLLAVTILTSWDSNKLSSELIIDQPIEQRVELLANLAVKAGLGGCVCSPLEVKNLRKLFFLPFELVTPGIRPKGSSVDDQSRVMTPKEALHCGASRIVVGRPITHSTSPLSAFKNICKELAES